MARNRFEQVDDIQPDAITLTLIQKSDGQIGIVHCPNIAGSAGRPDEPGDADTRRRERCH